MSAEPRQFGREHLLQAKAAEWAVASQLALRGHTPLFPGVDVGYDLMLDNGLRLQVKSASLRENNLGMKGIERHLGYFFDLRRGAWLSNERKWKRTNLRPYSDVADYFVLWGVEENRFFILPTSDKRQRIWFTRKGVTSKSNNKRVFNEITAKRLAEIEDRWDLLDISSMTGALIDSAQNFEGSGAETQALRKEN